MTHDKPGREPVHLTIVTTLTHISNKSHTYKHTYNVYFINPFTPYTFLHTHHPVLPMNQIRDSTTSFSIGDFHPHPPALQ